MVLHDKRDRELKNTERKDRDTNDADNTKGKHTNFNKPKNQDKHGFAGGSHFAVDSSKWTHE